MIRNKLICFVENVSIWVFISFKDCEEEEDRVRLKVEIMGLVESLNKSGGNL